MAAALHLRPKSSVNADAVWMALALVLVLEGLFPFASPRGWRKLFEQLLQLQDGQIRFFGMFMVIAGLMLLWWVS